jgi:hypothetical protein
MFVHIAMAQSNPTGANENDIGGDDDDDNDEEEWDENEQARRAREIDELLARHEATIVALSRRRADAETRLQHQVVLRTERIRVPEVRTHSTTRVTRGSGLVTGKTLGSRAEHLAPVSSLNPCAALHASTSPHRGTFYAI